MDWQQKLAAFNALTDHDLKMRKPDDWYVSGGIEVAGDGMLTGMFGNGASPEEAVEDHWRQLVDDLKAHQYLAVHSHGKRIYRKWNSYMWEDADHLRKRHAPQEQ